MAAQFETQRDDSDPELDGSENLALPVPDEEAPGAEKIPGSSVPLAVEEDLGAVEVYDEYRNWKDDYADAVGISRWREL